RWAAYSIRPNPREVTKNPLLIPMKCWQRPTEIKKQAILSGSTAMESLQQRIGLMATMLVMISLISGCRGQLTVTVPLPMLVNNPAAFDDRHIVTQGVVRNFNDPLHLTRVDQLPDE
ncbi:MAG: hypothetical protein ACTJG4_16940, partial [Vreelandella alkaliphila]